MRSTKVSNILVFKVVIARQVSTSATSKLKPFQEIPGPKPLPVIGNIWRYLPLIGDYRTDTLFENAQYNKERYGSLVREQITRRHTILHLFKPEDIEEYFRQDGKCPYRRSHRALHKYRHDRPELYNSGGLFSENGPKWAEQRAKFQKRLMSNSQVAQNIGKLDEVSLKFLNWLEFELAKGKIDSVIKDFEFLLYKWALGNTLRVFLDMDIDKLKPEYVNELIQIIHNTLTSTDKTEIQTDKWIKKPHKCSHYKMLAESQEFLHDFVSNEIDKLSSESTHLQSNFSYPIHWLRTDKIDRKDIITFIIDSFMAGLHTTSYTTAFMLYYISNDESILEKLQYELNEVIPNCDRPLTISDIDKMVLLQDCLKETLRLNPVSIGTGRLTKEDNIVLRDYTIPKDTMIITQNQAISRDDQIYEAANEFRPSRWSNYRACPRDLKPSPFATLPFGFGARACIGQRLAKLQIKVLTVRLLQKYRIKFLHEIPIKTTLIHTIDGNLNVETRPINP